MRNLIEEPSSGRRIGRRGSRNRGKTLVAGGAAMPPKPRKRDLPPPKDLPPVEPPGHPDNPIVRQSDWHGSCYVGAVHHIGARRGAQVGAGEPGAIFPHFRIWGVDVGRLSAYSHIHRRGNSVPSKTERGGLACSQPLSSQSRLSWPSSLAIAPPCAIN